MNILVIDAHGGGVGKALVSELKKEIADSVITAVGTNSAATAAMKKAGADFAATGENSVVVCSRNADVIVGPVGIVIADSLLGEITPKMAEAVGKSPAKRVLIPMKNCGNIVAGVGDFNMTQLISEAVREIKSIAG